MKIEEIDYGIAYQCTDSDGKKYIQVNKHLKEDPELYAHVLAHEMEHYHSKNKYIDFWIDFKPKPYEKQLKAWCKKHPESRWAWSPIVWDKGEASVNVYMTIVWIIIIALFVFNIVMIAYLYAKV